MELKAKIRHKLEKLFLCFWSENSISFSILGVFDLTIIVIVIIILMLLCNFTRNVKQININFKWKHSTHTRQ